MNHQSLFRTLLVRFFIYGPLIIVALVSIFYLYGYYHASTLVVSESVAPDLIAKNLDAWQFNVQGQPQYHVLSNTATHYHKDNRTHFSQVTGYVYMPQQPFWKITADIALATNGDEKVFLNGHVYIHQAAGKKNLAQTLTTDYLTVYPAKKIAQTDAPITATRTDMVTTSKGAYLDLNTNLIKLYQAYTIYTPTH